MADDIFVVLGLLGFLIFFSFFMMDRHNDKVMNDICSKNGSVSDTFYDENRGLCVMTLCRDNTFQFNKSECYFKPED